MCVAQGGCDRENAEYTVVSCKIYIWEGDREENDRKSVKKGRDSARRFLEKQRKGDMA